MSPDPFEIIKCPHCKGTLTPSNDEILCVSCNRVGRMWHGILDFLPGAAEIRVAEEGTIDLKRDEKVAEETMRSRASLNYDALVQLASQLRQDRTHCAAEENRADARYSKWYWQVEQEVGLRHGHAILAKLDAFLMGKGWAAASGNWAIEAGGGPGKFLPGFAERFKAVVCFDCSLVNLALGQKLAAECGLANVLFVRGNVEQLPFQSDTFDFVHQNGVIEHVADPVSMVREALRVLSGKGTYLCLSPNRFPITPEPHFKLPLYGLFPKALRRMLLPRVRGSADESGTDLKSLYQLRRIFNDSGSRPFIFFLPRRLSSTARSTVIRRLVKNILSNSLLGGMLSFLINGPLLPIMPYHFAIVHRDKSTS